MSQVKKGAGSGGEGNAREAELAKEIKSFRKTFKSEHGRDPSRKDMNKFSEIAKAYDAWLAIKSNSTASTSTLPTSSSSSSAVSSKPGTSAVSKRKADTSATGDSPRKKKGLLHSTKDNSSTQASESSMAPPPTTPSKERKHKKVTYEPISSSSSAFVTPTKKAKAASLSSIASPTAGIHDSGGSIIDVPSTPRSGDGRGGSRIAAGTSPLSPSASRSSQGQYQRHTRQTSRTYESPSKIRALLSSFSSIHRTPTKDSSRTEDAQIMQRLTKGPLPAYTPRTKARKRLRGEVVVTPEKNRIGSSSSSGEGVNSIAGHLGGSGGLQAGSQLPPQKKKRRGMATNTNTTTLRDYGIIPVAGPKARSSGGQGQLDRREKQPRGGGETLPQLNAAGSHSTTSQRDDMIDASDGEDDEEGEDMLGPSPSANRVVNRPIKSFQPLFGLSTGAVAAAVDDDMEEVEEEEEVAKAENKPTEAKKKEEDDEAMHGGETILDDGEDSNIIVVPYRPYGRNNSYQRRGAAFSDDEEEDEQEDRDDLGLHFYDRIAPGLARTFGGGLESGSLALSDDDDDDADTAHLILDNLSLNSPQMKKARQYQRTKNERNIRNLLGRDDKLQPLDDWEGQQQQQGGHQTKNGSAPQPKTNKVGPAIKGGKLRKGFKDLKSNISSNTRLTKESTETTSSKLVLQNSRDQLGSDEESDVGNRSDYDGNNDDDDEWASDVGSAEYGLGDGYMSDL